MSEMKPLLDSEMPEELARVLRSARADGPPQDEPVAARALAAVAAHRAAASNADRTTSSGLPFTKTLLAFVVAGSVGVMSFLATRVDVRVPHGAEPSPITLPSEPTAAPVPPSPTTSESVSVDDLPSAPVQAPAKTTASRSATRGASELDLEDELAIIDAARAALAAKQPETTLKQVQTYARRFHGGHFSEEAQALEIQALAAMGRRDEAAIKGQRFLDSHPGSAYERRVRSALATGVTP
ncbi:hypothetical protein AKJ09_04483 [Labilithrix luteola]|uniref:Uncharacterized protein n=1 Tax=Labilithrix luteola TaxID=1391654 RepID=A0A0K1PXF5_9BACT|nr:hypothetical protein [Labilithrix luteola]AKU97819.1 hypothetical protein AKJ09_04483 [Labilithrix luteola]